MPGKSEKQIQAEIRAEVESRKAKANRLKDAARLRGQAQSHAEAATAYGAQAEKLLMEVAADYGMTDLEVFIARSTPPPHRPAFALPGRVVKMTRGEG